YHPGIGDIFEASTILFGVFIVQLGENTANFGHVGFVHFLPGFPKRGETSLDLLLCVDYTANHGIVHGSLEAAKEFFLLVGEFVVEFGASGVKAFPRLFDSPAGEFSESFELLARVALNFVGERGGGSVGSLSEKIADALEGIVDGVFHLLASLRREGAAGAVKFVGKRAGDFARLLAEMLGGFV